MPRIPIAAIALAAIAIFSCNRSRTAPAENEGLSGTPAAGQKAPSKPDGSVEPAPAVPETETAAEEETAVELPPGAATLPDLSGLAGMDPDAFPGGEEGLDAIVEAYTTVGEKAKEKAESQSKALEGKDLIALKDLAACLPATVKGWKAYGKATSSQQKHMGVLLPMAMRVFRQGETVLASITIMDTLKTTEIRVGFEVGLAITKKTKTPRQKAVTVDGQPGYILVRQEKPEAPTEEGMDTSKGALLVDGRFLVVVTAENIADFDEIYAILSAAKIDKLIGLGKAPPAPGK
jgi:hypothetical protein